MSTLNYYKNSFSLPDPDWTVRISEAAYHRDALHGAAVTSGMLKEFRLCPAHYRALTTGREQRRDSDAYRIGRAVHKLVLEGEDAYRTAFAVGGPVNEKTGRAFYGGLQGIRSMAGRVRTRPRERHHAGRGGGYFPDADGGLRPPRSIPPPIGGMGGIVGAGGTTGPSLPD